MSIKHQLQYINAIHKTTSMLPTWDPSHSYEIGDYGKVNRQTGHFEKAGNLFNDEEFSPRFSALVEKVLKSELANEIKRDHLYNAYLGGDVHISNAKHTNTGVDTAFNFNYKSFGAVLAISNPTMQSLFPQDKRIQNFLLKAIQKDNKFKKRIKENATVITSIIWCHSYAILAGESSHGDSSMTLSLVKPGISLPDGKVIEEEEELLPNGLVLKRGSGEGLSLMPLLEIHNLNLKHRAKKSRKKRGSRGKIHASLDDEPLFVSAPVDLVLDGRDDGKKPDSDIDEETKKKPVKGIRLLM